MIPAESVERVTTPSLAAFRERFVRAGGRPVVITGACDHWPARHWTFDSLRRRLGSQSVEVVILREGHARVDLEHGFAADTMDVQAYLGQVEHIAPPRHYLRLRLAGAYGFLRDEIEVPRYCAGSFATIVSLLVGGAGMITDTHYDMLHNLMVQLRGRRRITLFAPGDRAALYPYPMRTLLWHHSQVRLEAPDPIAFPRFAAARRYVVELDPGDMLFIPRGWWHHFESLEPSIAVNFFWLTARLLPAIAAARALWMVKRIKHY